MAAHLARHMSSHGVKPAKKAAKTSGRRRGRPPGSKNKKTAGSSRSFAGVNLGSMHLHELTDLIEAARAEARVKLRELEVALA
ncbi:MAG: hypothetical protein H6819_08010 [Phycisphaerales bacterium]|nr:hypothetical protein [Phycisphaerales bacterium]MCB9854280.1 hypothetical protein [Phycisphaerales bacterium]